MLAGVVPPALRLYCSRRSHYYNIENGILSLSFDAWHTLMFPSILYHELSHHVSWVLYKCDQHDETFYTILLTMLEKEGKLQTYLFSCEYAKGVKIGKKLNLIPKEYNPKQWDTIAHMRGGLEIC